MCIRDRSLAHCTCFLPLSNVNWLWRCRFISGPSILFHWSICIKFWLSLNIPPRKLFRWFRRLQLWATGNWQLHHYNAPAHSSCLMWFFGEISNHSGDSASLQPRFGALWLLAFLKTNHLWKGRDFRLLMRLRKIRKGSRWWLGELCVVPRCPLWRRLRRHCPMYNVSCILDLLQ